MHSGAWKKDHSGAARCRFVLICVLFISVPRAPGPLYAFAQLYSAELLTLLLLIGYRLLTIRFLQGTIGMLLCRLQFLNTDEQPLSVKESLLASVFVLYRGDYYKK